MRKRKKRIRIMINRLRNKKRLLVSLVVKIIKILVGLGKLSLINKVHKRLKIVIKAAHNNRRLIVQIRKPVSLKVNHKKSLKTTLNNRVQLNKQLTKAKLALTKLRLRKLTIHKSPNPLQHP